MDRDTFSTTLQLESVPLCATCKDLLWQWSESDPRTEIGKQLWAAFVRHFVECRQCERLQNDVAA